MDIIKTLEAPLPDDPEAPIPKEDPFHDRKEQLQEMRRMIGARLNQMQREHNATISLDQVQPQLQMQAMIKYVCQSEEDRIVFEHCYLSALLEMVDLVEAQIPRAKLLGNSKGFPVPPDIRGKEGR